MSEFLWLACWDSCCFAVCNLTRRPEFFILEHVLQFYSSCVSCFVLEEDKAGRGRSSEHHERNHCTWTPSRASSPAQWGLRWRQLNGKPVEFGLSYTIQLTQKRSIGFLLGIKLLLGSWYVLGSRYGGMRAAGKSTLFWLWSGVFLHLVQLILPSILGRFEG